MADCVRHAFLIDQIPAYLGCLDEAIAALSPMIETQLAHFVLVLRKNLHRVAPSAS